MAIQVGTAEARPGAMTFGYLEALQHFDGTAERLPVVIACGRHDGPCFWVTANIHGNEYVGLLAVQSGITQALAPRLDELHGTVVAIPSLNPSGLRVGRRQPYYDPSTDPNRTFPDAARMASGGAAAEQPESEEDEDAPTPYETVSAAVFERLAATADFHVDLHAMDLQATPFSIRDHVLYRGEEQRAAAEQLSARIDGLARAFGIPVVNEYPAKKYLTSKLHRSTGGAAVHIAGIPSITPELGMSNDVDAAALRAGIAGIHNVLVWAEMLPDAPITIDWIAQPDLGYPVRREPHPRATRAGVVEKRVRPGDIVRAGDPVAQIRDIWGRPLGDDDGLLRTEHDGWVINLRSGVAAYPNRSVLDLAVRDDNPPVEPWPEP
ncbi:MAG: succinylglutamate desuccinylase/aspartoacylase family protein [Ktedonobacterales bacterium]